jgi:hypothetical protein
MFALVTWVAFSSGARACRCVQASGASPACQSISTAVFAGRVVKIEADSARIRHVFFEVTAAYRGDRKSVV